VGLLTRIPVPLGTNRPPPGDAARYFPLVGILVGGAGALATFAAAWLLPFPLAVLLGMAATLLATGAFHEDGFADACDGFGGGRERGQVLAIMKDARLGSYGTLGITLLLLTKWQSLAALGPLAYAALPAGHALSRLAPVMLMRHLAYARDLGTARTGPLAPAGPGTLAVALLFGLAPLVPLGGAALPGLLLATLATLLAARLFAFRLGGYTGDCLGAAQQVAEAAFYLGVLCACC
jgi:adenosylcobinamide-GDP ribazoletransferase